MNAATLSLKDFDVCHARGNNTPSVWVFRDHRIKRTEYGYVVEGCRKAYTKAHGADRREYVRVPYAKDASSLVRAVTIALQEIYSGKTPAEAARLIKLHLKLLA